MSRFSCILLGVLLPGAVAAEIRRHHDIDHDVLLFEENRGQAHPGVSHLARGSGHDLFLSAGEAVLVFPGPGSSPALVRVELAGANPAAEARGARPLDAWANYFAGSDPAGWHADLPLFAAVEYRDVYPGVDLIVGGRPGRVEYRFRVGEGADADAIEFRLPDSSRRVRLIREGLDATLLYDFEPQSLHRTRDPRGNRAAVGTVRLSSFAHEGEVPGLESFVLVAGNPSDGAAFYTYLGGEARLSSVNSAAFDEEGSIYLTGSAGSRHFPLSGDAAQRHHGGATDAFVVQLSPEGNRLLLATCVGGSGEESGHGIAVDSQGAIHIAGTIGRGENRDAFVARLGPRLEYLRLLGGQADDEARALALDSRGRAWVAGSTRSADFPVTGASLLPPDSAATGRNAFLSRIGRQGGLHYSMLLGGSGEDAAKAVAVDDLGRVLLAGHTASADFPLLGPGQARRRGAADAFLSRFDPEGNLLHSTYLGAEGFDSASTIWLEGEDVHLAGHSSVDFSSRAFKATAARDGSLSIAPVTPSDRPRFTAEPAASVDLPVDPTLGCPGFYIATVKLDEGAGDGAWGMEVLTTAGRRLLQGGINLGGAIQGDAGPAVGFAAFNIANSRGEPQEVRVEVTAQPISAGPENLDLTLSIFRSIDGNRVQVGQSATGSTQISHTETLEPGFYIVRMESAAGSPHATFQMALTTSFVDRAGGAFQGGVNVGGFLTREEDGDSVTGFAAFCISEAQTIKIRTEGRPTRGSLGAGDLVLAVSDRDRKRVFPPFGDADLSILMAGPDLVTVLDPDPALGHMHYTITVTNAGPDSATGVQVVDTLPVDPITGATASTLVSASAECTPGAGIVTCELGELAVNSSASVELEVNPAVDVQGRNVTNIAEATANQTDPDPSDNSASVETSVVPGAGSDLSVTITDSPDPVAPGELLTYEVKVVNGGNTTATNVTLTNTLPAGVSGVDGVVTGGADCTESATQIVCTWPVLTRNEPETLTFRVTVDSGTTGTLTNTAEVIGDEFDPDPDDNTATETTTVSN